MSGNGDNFNIEDLFNTIPYTKTLSNTNVGIKNRLLATSALNFEPRSDRIQNRFIDNKPFKILDAPGMIDDYYLNLLQWSNDIVGIGLSEQVYVYNYTNGEVHEIYNSQSPVTSINMNESIVSIGINDGKMIFYNLDKQEVIAIRNNHATRIGAHTWNQNLLASGDKSGKIIVQDTRTNVFDTLHEHTQEVCGLEWSPDYKYIASGSNDNDIRIWYNNHLYRTLREHKSAVKALAWCPWKSGVLATGGGTKDKSIKFWDVCEGKKIQETAVQSQVCTLTYISKYKELISSHGYVENNIVLWKASTMKEITSFGKHDSRVLHTALSPDNTILASVSADENLKFWKISDKSKKPTKRASIGVR